MHSSHNGRFILLLSQVRGFADEGSLESWYRSNADTLYAAIVVQTYNNTSFHYTLRFKVSFLFTRRHLCAMHVVCAPRNDSEQALENYKRKKRLKVVRGEVRDQLETNEWA